MSRIYFTDRDLGKQFPRILSEAGIPVERHADLFLPDGSDEQWLEHCGTNDRVAITHNSRIRYVPNELAAVKLRREVADRRRSEPDRGACTQFCADVASHRVDA